MSQKAIWILILIMVIGLILNNASAGTENNPEITDSDNDADDSQNPTADNDGLEIISAWFIDLSNTTMRFNMKVKSLASIESETDYVFYWQFRDENYFCRLREDDEIKYEYGTWVQGGGSTAYTVNGTCTGSYMTGTPGYIVLELEKGVVGSPELDDSLGNTEVRTHRRDPNTRTIDWAEGDDFILNWSDLDGDDIHDDEDSDDDGDGYSDEEEKLAGTDPRDSHDYPQDTSTRPDGNNDDAGIPGFGLTTIIALITVLFLNIRRR